MTAADHTRDALLGGRIQIEQPRRGQRASADAVMLAAAVPARRGQQVLELGAGSGVGMLCLAARLPGISIDGVEIQPALVALCTRNIVANALADRLRVVEGDLRRRIAGIQPNSYDQVFANPPYFGSDRHRASPDAGRATARSESDGADLSQWIAAMLRHARPGGRLTLIHKTDRLADILRALGGQNGKQGAGGIRIVPLQSRAGQAAKRIIVSAVKGSRAPLELAPGLVLHQDDGSYVPAVDAMLRSGAAFPG